MGDSTNQNGDNSNTSANNNDGQNSNTSANNNGGEAQVTMSQKDLDNLINGKYAKGADKATNELLKSLGVDSKEALQGIIDAQKAQEDANKSEMEKLLEKVASLEAQNGELTQEKEKASANATINSMAVKHGIKDVEYFTFALKQAKVGEDFNEEEFISDLKKNKPYVFGEKPNTDNSSNGGGQTNTFKDKLKGMSFNDLKRLQANI